jgi:hypothetical protein
MVIKWENGLKPVPRLVLPPDLAPAKNIVDDGQAG